MKNTKRYIVIVCLVAFGALSYGFIARSGIFKNHIESTKTSSVEKKSKATFMPPPETEIVGTWLDEAEEGHKLEFSANGEVKIYSDNVVVMTSIYEITNTCNGSTYNGLYLKIYDDEDGEELCSYIHGINANNSGILSIASTDNLRTEVYHKQ